MTHDEILAIALKALKGGGGGGGTSNYNDLTNLPKINNVTLMGNKTSFDINVVDPSIITDNEFDETQAYSIGDIVVYEAKLYQFIADHTADDPWDSTEVTEKNLMEIMDSIPKAIKISQVDYDALPTAEKEDLSKIYYVYDAQGSGGIVIDDNTTASNKVWSSSKVNTELGTKVTAVSGKGLSTNDYTNEEKTKLANIPSGAEANVQSDWEQDDDTADDYIKHKPTIPPGVVVDQTYDASSTNAQSGTAVASAISGKADTSSLGTAAYKNVPVSGNASVTQVVMGGDTRLSDSRAASDVYPWAKSVDKPTYTASEVGAIPSTDKGANSGVATLDANGKVPTSQLPSYVDDVLEYDSQSEFPPTGESGKIYVAKDTNKTYRWGGSSYVEISASLALGETTGTAYEGSKGKANADNISTIQGLIPSTATTSNKLATASDVSAKQDTLTFDDAPTNGSSNPVKSGGVYTALSGKQNTLTFDDAPTSGSDNPVKSGGVYTALASKQATLTAGENITIENNVISASGGGGSLDEALAYLDTTAGFVSKNKLYIRDIEDYTTIDGVTFSVTRDYAGDVSKIRVNGTPNNGQDVDFILAEHVGYIDANDVLTGTPSGGSYSTYYMRMSGTYGAYTYDANDYGDGGIISNSISNATVKITIKNGYTASNLDFYPMIRSGAVTNTTFQTGQLSILDRLNSLEGKNPNLFYIGDVVPCMAMNGGFDATKARWFVPCKSNTYYNIYKYGSGFETAGDVKVEFVSSIRPTDWSNYISISSFPTQLYSGNNTYMMVEFSVASSSITNRNILNNIIDAQFMVTEGSYRFYVERTESIVTGDGMEVLARFKQDTWKSNAESTAYSVYMTEDEVFEKYKELIIQISVPSTSSTITTVYEVVNGVKIIPLTLRSLTQIDTRYNYIPMSNYGLFEAAQSGSSTVNYYIKIPQYYFYGCAYINNTNYITFVANIVRGYYQKSASSTDINETYIASLIGVRR